MAACLAPPLFVVYMFLSEFLAVDSALDAGASYNYATGEADYSQNHHYIPFYSRYPILCLASLISMGALSAMVISKLLKRETEQTGAANPLAPTAPEGD